MAGPFARRAGGLKREAETPQQPAHQLMADHKAALGQRAGEMTLALTDPQQRRLRIARNGRLDKFGERFKQAGLPLDRRLATAAGPADPAAEMVLGRRAVRPTRDRWCFEPPRSPRIPPSPHHDQPSAPRSPQPVAARVRQGPRSSRNGATASKRDLMAATSITSPKYQHRRSRNIYILILLLRSTHNPDSFQPIRLFRPTSLSTLTARRAGSVPIIFGSAYELKMTDAECRRGPACACLCAEVSARK